MPEMWTYTHTFHCDSRGNFTWMMLEILSKHHIVGFGLHCFFFSQTTCCFLVTQMALVKRFKCPLKQNMQFLTSELTLIKKKDVLLHCFFFFFLNEVIFWLDGLPTQKQVEPYRSCHHRGLMLSLKSVKGHWAIWYLFCVWMQVCVCWNVCSNNRNINLSIIWIHTLIPDPIWSVLPLIKLACNTLLFMRKL